MGVERTSPVHVLARGRETLVGMPQHGGGVCQIPAREEEIDPVNDSPPLSQTHAHTHTLSVSLSVTANTTHHRKGRGKG